MCEVKQLSLAPMPQVTFAILTTVRFILATRFA